MIFFLKLKKEYNYRASWCGSHSTSINACGVWEIRAGVQVSRREFHTHIHLDYVIAEIISYIYIYMCVCVCVCGPILPCVQTVCEEGPGPISRVRANEYPRRGGVCL